MLFENGLNGDVLIHIDLNFPGGHSDTLDPPEKKGVHALIRDVKRCSSVCWIIAIIIPLYVETVNFQYGILLSGAGN